MLVLRKTMNAAVLAEATRGADRLCEIAHRYGAALAQVAALQKQLSAWILNEPRNITPRQMAQMFYAQNDDWQATFFNVLQDEIRAEYDSRQPGPFDHPGVPPGEAQWWHMAKHLDDSGFETLEAMYEHARTHRYIADRLSTKGETP